MSEAQTKTSRPLIIFTRTPLHVGAGSSVGAIDQPIQRERHTGFPIIPGSSLKGVLRDHLRGVLNGHLDDVFGRGGSDEEYTAGQVSFAEARLLCFPVRSAKGAFALATSPLALRRYARDAGLGLDVPDQPKDMTCMAGFNCSIDKNGKKGVVLEEYRFEVQGEFPTVWEAHLSMLLDDAVLKGAKGRFVLLSDGDLGHFAVNACQVNQHVRINDETGTAEKGGLFNEETVPSETLFTSAITRLKASAGVDQLTKAMNSEQLVQFGGNGTTGSGFCTVKLAK
jgi:CRISPR-associated protein Cmr4